jgi:class 3 adenylate cyclase
MSGASSSVGTATVMFTDLVGSTELRSRIGEEAADALRALRDSILTEAVASNDGRVVKHLGDGIMATFPGAANGVSAAVMIQQDLDLANRRGAEERMQVRIGISIGDVTFEGDDLFGLPVVEAQRLEASAEPSTIRCAEMVMLMARGRGGHDFRALGELELKGLNEPLAACEVVWSPVAAPEPVDVELGLPPVFAHGTGLPFSGRSEVFEQLVDAWTLRSGANWRSPSVRSTCVGRSPIRSGTRAVSTS